MNGNPLDELTALLGDDLGAVTNLLGTRMESQFAPRIPAVAAYLIDAGGKRIRPMLTLAAAQMCGYDGPYHIHLAATVEFIHTATLLHDDVVDGSEQRRGRPSANLLWDNSSSVLVGDYMFSRAFQLMVDAGSLKILSLLADASATIAEGEVLQLSAQHDLKTDQETYMRIIDSKTSALFSAACQVGAVLANAPQPIELALKTYGNALGIAFQLIDDYLDYMGDADKLGKRVGDDFRDRKLTLPIIKAFAKADRNEQDFWKRTIGKGQQEPGDLEQAQKLFAKTGALTDTRDMAVDYAQRARAALDPLPESPLKDIMQRLPDFVVSRSS